VAWPGGWRDGLNCGAVLAQSAPAGVPQPALAGRAAGELPVFDLPDRRRVDPACARHVLTRWRDGERMGPTIQGGEAVLQAPSFGLAKAGAHIADVQQDAGVLVVGSR
jgi:hypothetical protein